MKDYKKRCDSILTTNNIFDFKRHNEDIHLDVKNPNLCAKEISNKIFKEIKQNLIEIK